VPLRQHLAGTSEQRLQQVRQIAAGATTPWLCGDGHIRFVGHGYYLTAARLVG
jgi:hypothetical protein